MPGSCRSLVDRWHDVATELPGRTAFSSAGSAYTFADADAASDRIAAALVATIGGDERPVGLLAGHDANALVALLAIQKAERIVVVLDPHLPAERLRDIASLAGLATILVDEDRLALATELDVPTEGLIPLEAHLVPADPESTPTGSNAPGSNAPGSIAPGSIAPGSIAPGFTAPGRRRSGADGSAIVFTSGSTGRPKGVIQTHDQLLNEVYSNGERFRITPEDRVALVFPYGFAAGLSLLWVAVLNGAAVHAYDPRDSGARRLGPWVRENRITTLHCTPHLLRSLVATLSPGQVFDSLRLVGTVGEAVHGSDVQLIRPHLLRSASFFNWCGSSEMGALTLYEVRADDPLPSGGLPVGTPIANKEVWIRHADGSPVADGEAGEVVAVSSYLSGGYWNDDAGNASRFQTLGDQRRTCKQGDLGRLDAQGNLTLLGRADAATKVRGYLVEPSEVEAAFLRIEGVKDVVVVPIVAPPAPTRLVAFVVPDPQQRTQSPASLRRQLREKLPEYMVPATIVQLAELPRNERGKVDRSQLPEVQSESHSEPPTSQRDLVLAAIWGEVLGLDTVGLDDDFMALGGDSLSAEEVLATVQDRLGISLVSSDLIKAPTLREFSRRVQLGKASLPSHPDVVTLRSEGDQTPIHCFAGAGALALTFLPVSRHLDDRPIYAYQSHGLEKRARPDWSVPAAARRCLEIMRIVQPRGPYILLGHSFGGLIALEIASQLTSAGEDVRLVALLDTYQPRTVGQTNYDYETIPDRPSGPVALRQPKAYVMRQLTRMLPDGVPAVEEWSRHLRAYLAGMVPFDGQKQFDAFFDQIVIVSRRYQIPPHAGPALLVLAENNPDGRDAWTPFLKGPAEFVQIAAEHSSLLREPHATELAQVIAAELSRRY